MYFLIRPLKVEVASPEPHSILVIHNMISDEEADSLIEQVIVKGIVNLMDFPSAIRKYSSLPNTSLGRDNSLGWERS